MIDETILIPILVKHWVETKNKPSAELNEISHPICARDHNGFNNWGMTGVVVATREREREYKDRLNNTIRLGSIETSKGLLDRQGCDVYDINGICTTLTANGGGYAHGTTLFVTVS